MLRLKRSIGLGLVSVFGLSTRRMYEVGPSPNASIFFFYKKNGSLSSSFCRFTEREHLLLLRKSGFLSSSFCRFFSFLVVEGVAVESHWEFCTVHRLSNRDLSLVEEVRLCSQSTLLYVWRAISVENMYTNKKSSFHCWRLERDTMRMRGLVGKCCCSSVSFRSTIPSPSALLRFVVPAGTMPVSTRSSSTSTSSLDAKLSHV